MLVWGEPPFTSVWRLSRGDEERFAKVSRVGAGLEPGSERDRLAWAEGRIPVPAVIAWGIEPGGRAGDASGASEALEWLVLEALPGVDATKVEMSPEDLVPALARGLARLHAADTDDCPFAFDLDTALALARERLSSGRIDPARDFHPEHAHHSAESAVAELERTRPADEDLVLCHGDYCPPNVLLAGGEVCGYLDLGELGVADRWWDLAVATWSLDWNLGPGWEPLFLETYGIEPRAERISYFRLLYDVVS